MASERLYPVAATSGADIDEMLERFDVVVSSWRLLQGGMLNTNIHVHATSGEQYLLRIYNPDRTRAQIDLEIGTLQRLHNAGVRCQVPQQGRGGFVQTWTQHQYALLSFIPGDSLPEATHESGVSEDVGRLLGEVHSVFGNESRLDATTALADIATIEDLLRPTFGHRPALLEAWVEVSSIAVAQPPLVGIVHGDVHPGNVVRSADGGLVLIDFDDVSLGPVRLDLATGAMEFAFGADTDLSTELVARFVRGYESARGRVENTATTIDDIWFNCFRFFAYTIELLKPREALEENVYFRRVMSLKNRSYRDTLGREVADWMEVLRRDGRRVGD